ncbi:hypothetical protein [Tropicimonas sp. IMCC6043]|uniref:hypothetical protein n=1 Tax=Tropicimonas sp. IMCC6043 TaxID=2510645 RepID=UPI00101DEDCD|nr:hypothetical protein [Tropicimonas sp. IMCC6043]RYH10132.1 hypothetical protein EU800_09615 [Tropicimonas sp. IMCC6043]
MTKNLALLLALFGMLAACGDGDGTNPVNRPGEEETDGGGSEEEETVLPGTKNPTSDGSITRYEEQDDTSGNGYAQSVSYDSSTDTFYVDNLGFDAANVYKRDDQVASLGSYRVYEASDTFYDSMTGKPISQLTPYKAIHGVSRTGQTQFAIVRTGAYIDYGFGGFLYARNGSVTLPTAGQATYAGDYAGLRDFKARGDLEYVTGDMTVDIDFEDFNDGDAVKGRVFNRRVYAMDGTDITDQIVGAIEGATALPSLVFEIGPGVTTEAGEISGGVTSTYYNDKGALEQYEGGNYYAIVSGKNAEEIVGVIVVESEDPRFEGVTARETGGFILYR